MPPTTTQAVTTASVPRVKKPQQHVQAPRAPRKVKVVKPNHISHSSSKPQSSNHGQSKKAQGPPQTHGNGGGKNK
jgi:hypothetical protein